MFRTWSLSWYGRCRLSRWRSSSMSWTSPSLPGQEVDGPDAAGCDGPGPVGDLVVDVGGGHHRLMTFDAGLILDPAEDSPLASVQLAVDIGVHSKTSWGERLRVVKYLDCSPKPGGFRASRPRSASDYAWLRTRTPP